MERRQVAYAVKEIFYSLQGEGARTGRAAVFCRLTGCNLWSGHETDRQQACCPFCDTDFVGTNGPGGGNYPSAAKLADAIAEHWPGHVRRGGSVHAAQPDAGGLPVRPYVVLTGGEPLLQVNKALIDALHARGFEVAVETNGTLPAPAGIDWVTVSPKASTRLVLRQGSELKLVFPQPDLPPWLFESAAPQDHEDSAAPDQRGRRSTEARRKDAAPQPIEGFHFEHYFLQPMAGCDIEANIRQTVEYCLAHPQWRLSLQMHKIVGIM